MGASSRWELNEGAFDLLLRGLGGSREEAAVRYEELRTRLIRIFLWDRAIDPENLADQAFSRLARRLQEGEAVTDLTAYLFGIARNLIREDAASRARQRPLEEFPAKPNPDGEQERQFAALEQCLAALDGDKRRVVLAYYQGDHRARIANRQRLAADLGLEINALRNRALRLREKLEECVRSRLRRDGSAGHATKERTAR